MKDFWEQRYREPIYAYGLNPSIFFQKTIALAYTLCNIRHLSLYSEALLLKNHAINHVNLTSSELLHYPFYWSGAMYQRPELESRGSVDSGI